MYKIESYLMNNIDIALLYFVLEHERKCICKENFVTPRVDMVLLHLFHRNSSSGTTTALFFLFFKEHSTYATI